jgi:hypothetical protein
MNICLQENCGKRLFSFIFRLPLIVSLGMVFGLQLHVQSVPIITKVVRSNPVHGEEYSIKHYMIKFVSDLRQVGGFL